MQFNPPATALVAMDFQPNIQASAANSSEVTSRAAEAIATIRKAGGHAAFVRVAFTLDELAAFPAHSVMGQRMKSVADKVLADAPATQLDPRLGAREGDISVRKRRVGPFSTTDLDAQLKAAGVDTLVLAGIQTSGCVLTAVREASDLDYRLIVLSDACADPDAEMHAFLLNRVFPRQASVMTLADYTAAIGAAEKA
jgi:nicotinamidase-related amidase